MRVSKELRVIVEVRDEGGKKRFIRRVVTKDGQLMTIYLERLIKGRGYYHGDSREADRREVQFVGLVWLKPYTLLAELVKNRLELQSELFKLEGESELTQLEPTEVPEEAANATISSLVLKELENRRKIQAHIKELDRIKEEQRQKADDYQ